MARSLLLLLALAACNGATNQPAQNTELNARDRSGALPTPIDQGNDAADLRITQEIRQGVVGNDHLSTLAKNVKIITVDGVVTLRGPVNNEQEKTDIGAIAQGVEGVRRIDNQLDVTAG